MGEAVMSAQNIILACVVIGVVYMLVDGWGEDFADWVRDRCRRG